MIAALPMSISPSSMSNRLLAGLPLDDITRLVANIHNVQVSVGTVLYEPGEVIKNIYFPNDSLISLWALVEERMTLEVALVGCEGVLGSSAALGNNVSGVRAIVQRAGTVSCIDSEHFCTEFKKNFTLQKIIYCYNSNLLAQVIQIAVCSRFHLLEARLARSLLTTRDRLQSEKFHLTHEFLAHALGVRRVGVTKAASALQQKQIITYSRGNIEIVDAYGLETVSCRCYELTKNIGGNTLSNYFI